MSCQCMNLFLSMYHHKVPGDFPEGFHYYQCSPCLQEQWLAIAASPEEAMVRIKSKAARGMRYGTCSGSTVAKRFLELVKYCELPPVRLETIKKGA